MRECSVGSLMGWNCSTKVRSTMANEEQKAFSTGGRKWGAILQIILTIAMMSFVIWQGITHGLQSKTSSELVGWILASIVLSVLIALFSYVLFKWDQISEHLENQFKIYPTIRRWFIIPGVLLSLVLGLGQLWYWHAEATLKILVAAYFGLLFPAAIISLVRDDRLRDKSPLGRKISRELFRQNPQATVAYAFTVVENLLREKIGADANIFGDPLINDAFAGEKSKLVLVLNGKDYTSQFRNFISGSYTLLRNPRHHTLVEDDENTAYSMYAVAELLMHFIELSSPRSTTDVDKEL